MIDFELDPKRTALINVDMQNCFVEGYPISAPDGPALVDRVNLVSAACRRAGIPVIHTRAVFRPDGSNVGLVGQFDSGVKNGFLATGTEPAEIHKRVVVDPRDIVLDKPRFGAFHATDLELILRSRGIDTIIITGIATNICCETTAREAAVREFRVFFLSDGTATFGIGELSPAELQRATCATLGMLFAQVLTTAEMLKKIDRVSRPSL